MASSSFLSANERGVLAILEASADAGLPCPSNEDIAETMGFESVAAPPGIIRRLERRGFVAVGRYQRSRIVRIVATGAQTRAPANTTIHWRNNDARVPTPSVPVMQARDPDMFELIQSAATECGVPISDYLCDLVHVGWRTRSGERVF